MTTRYQLHTIAHAAALLGGIGATPKEASIGIQALPNGKFRLQIRRKGKHIDEVFATHAKAVAAQSLLDGEHHQRKSEPLLDEVWALYLDSLDFTKKRERTRDTEASRIKRVLVAFGHLPITALNAGNIESYIVDRLKSKPTPSADAVRLEIAALSSVLNFARKRTLIPANPCIGVSRPSATPQFKRFHAEDEGRLPALLAHENFRFRFGARLCLLVRETGARPGEWVQARYQDINFDKRTILFPKTRYKAQPRTVPLTQAAQHLLIDQMEDLVITNLETFGATDWLFPAVGKDGEIRPFHYTGALRDIKKKGFLPKNFKAHTGRHEFISRLVESSDLDDSRIMSIIGHHSPSSMEIYKHVRNIRFRPQIDEIEPQRRGDRLRSIAKALNIPPRLAEVLLIRERTELVDAGINDDGDELLFSAPFIQKLHAFAIELGAAPKERMAAIARLREQLTEKAAAAPPATLEPVIESPAKPLKPKSSTRKRPTQRNEPMIGKPSRPN